MRYLTLFLLLCVLPVANAQLVSGSSQGAVAVGKWKESREGVSLFCAKYPFPSIYVVGTCFLTEAQATAKDAVKMSRTELFAESWDEHGLTAHAYPASCVDLNGNEMPYSRGGGCRGISVVIRIVLNFETHQVTKFVERSTGVTVEYHLLDP